MSSEDGLTIVLSPVQFATLLDGGSLDEHATTTNRLFGALTAVGGALELVGAGVLLLVPEPTALTKIAGVTLGAHGADTTSTGLVQIWTGRTQITMTSQAAAAAARAVGVSPEGAATVGFAVDIAVPLIAGFAGAARALAIRRGMISLAAEEAAGGHTIARHVARTETQLRQRLVQQPGISSASTFRTLTDAEKFVSAALRANAAAIRQWSQTAAVGATKSFTYSANNIGVGVVRVTGKLEQMNNMVVVVRKTQVGQKIYFVLTAYPKL